MKRGHINKLLSVVEGLALVGLFLSVSLVVGFAAPLEETEMTDREKRLHNELAEVEAQIAEKEQELNKQKQESSSLERDIAILTNEIQRARLNIQAKTITIQQLGQDIEERTQTIEELEQEGEERKGHLAHLLRKTNDQASYSLIEALLSNEQLSEFFIDIDDFHSIKRSINETVDELREMRKENSEQRELLSHEQDQELNARMVIEEEKRSIEANEAEKQRLLSISETQAQAYETELRWREQRAAEIRSALFALRDTDDIPFGQALEYARVAERASGIRPAFLLAVFQQESGLRDGRFGVNVGTCNRPDDERGWQDIMPGPNDNSWRDDQTIYLRLMKELGRDPDTQPLSCPFQVGWGGAMGPAQFIPTTWAEYQSRIAQAAGVRVPDPWDPQHAFIASALYLRDLGGAGGGYAEERRAALRYYAGGNWDSPANAFYGDGVMRNAQNLQRDIDILDAAN